MCSSLAALCSAPLYVGEDVGGGVADGAVGVEEEEMEAAS